jgi:hypothetical protein
MEPEQVLIVDRQGIEGTTVSRIADRLSEAGYQALKKYLSTIGNLGEYWRTSGFGQ